MKIVVCTMSHWDDPKNAEVWRRTLTIMLNGCRKFLPPYETVRPIIACGTWSDPALCPIDAEVINCHGDRNAHNHLGNDGLWHSDELLNCFTFCSFSASLSHALMTRWPFDLVMYIYHKQTVIGKDLGPVLDEFMSRKETFMAPSIWGTIADPSLCFFKKPAIVKYLNCRFRPNLIRFDDAPNAHMLIEHEIIKILKDDWWNPWPGITNWRMDGHTVKRDGSPITKHEVFNDWPGVTAMPHEWCEEYLNHKGINV